MKHTVCRAFTLYHDKIFANTSEEELQEQLKKDYLVIGYFDWFKTEKWDMNHYFSLTKLFDYNNQISKEGTAFQSFQNVFGFRSDDEDSPCTDAEFWSSENDDSLRFVLYLQMEKYRQGQFDKLQEILNDKAKDYSFVVYYTLDKNDFIICLKSNSYNTIIDVINNLYDKINKGKIVKGESQEDKDIIIYSYTCLIVKYDVINDPSSALIAEKDEVETINSICIKTILNNYNEKYLPIKEKIHRFCCDLSDAFYGDKAEVHRDGKEIVGYEILGDTDCRFIARDVPLNRLLHLFAKTGLLNRDHKLFKYCFVSSMTSLNKDTNKNTVYRHITNYGVIPNRKAIQIDRCRIDEIGERFENKNEYGHMLTLLYQIYDYISFISYQTSKYEYVSLQQPFELLIKLIETALDNNETSDRPFEELYEYLSNMYSNIQENMRTDIRFYGLSDFSVMSYYSPTKLRSFYFSVINKIADYYKSMSAQDEKIDYQFMIFFSNTATTNVTQLWKTKFDEDKLMMVKIAEKEFYEVKDLVFQLAHEAAHFVGNEDIRNREYRFYQYINFLLARINEYIKKEIGEEIKFINSVREMSGDNSINLEMLLKKAFKCNPLHKFISENQILLNKRTQQMIVQANGQGFITNEKYFYYTDIVKQIIGDYLYNDSFVTDFIMEYYSCIFSFIKKELMKEINNDSISVEAAKDRISQFNRIYEQLNDYIYEYSNQLLYAEISDSAFAVNVLYEAYADVSAVLLFDLPATELCEIMYRRLDLSDEDYTKDMGFIRMCMVLKAMNSVGANYECINPTYADFFRRIHDSVAETEDKQMKQFYQNINSVCHALDNREFFMTYLYDYIKLCLENQCERIDMEKRELIKQIYRSTDDTKLMETVIYINDFVAKLGEEEGK